MGLGLGLGSDLVLEEAEQPVLDGALAHEGVGVGQLLAVGGDAAERRAHLLARLLVDLPLDLA